MYGVLRNSPSPCLTHGSHLGASGDIILIFRTLGSRSIDYHLQSFVVSLNPLSLIVLECISDCMALDQLDLQSLFTVSLASQKCGVASRGNLFCRVVVSLTGESDAVRYQTVTRTERILADKNRHV